MSAPAGPLAQRLGSQLLAGPPARDALAVAERLLAIQGQDSRGARLAVRARSRGVLAADIDRALTEERSLLITWLNRGTLHLVRSEDYPWLHALTTPPLEAGSRRRLAQPGIDIDPAMAERGLGTVVRTLTAEGPRTRHQLGERLLAAGVPAAGQALVHLLYLASLRGLVVRGPMLEGEHAYALVSDWLPAARPFERSVALGELALRYLRGHGPASEKDLARWAGLPLRDARAGLSAVAPKLRGTKAGLVDLRRREPPPELPPPRLLGAFDPVLLGWCSRSEILGEAEPLVVSGGIFRAFALVGGRAAAVWRLRGGSLELEPWVPLSAEVREALEFDRGAVLRFLGR